MNDLQDLRSSTANHRSQSASENATQRVWFQRISYTNSMEQFVLYVSINTQSLIQLILLMQKTAESCLVIINYKKWECYLSTSQQTDQLGELRSKASGGT